MWLWLSLVLKCLPLKIRKIGFNKFSPQSNADWKIKFTDADLMNEAEGSEIAAVAEKGG